ncbi:MAG: hypothetical protein ACRDUS_06445 [Mycobacterium sp.]
MTARAVWHGAGRGVPITAPVRRLRRIIHKALDDRDLRVAARRLAMRMAADDPDIAVRELEHMATPVAITDP